MKTKIFKYIVVILISFSYSELGVVYGDEGGGGGDGFQEALSSVKDPFVSPIPVKRPESAVREKKKEVQLPKPLVVAPLTVPQPPVLVKPPSLKISGLVWNSSKPVAILNGQVVSIGQEVSGCLLKAVRQSAIDVVCHDKEFTMSFPTNGK